jgi:hypothetical protein
MRDGILIVWSIGRQRYLMGFTPFCLGGLRNSSAFQPLQCHLFRLSEDVFLHSLLYYRKPKGRISLAVGKSEAYFAHLFFQFPCLQVVCK